jgi:hypothetical protein
MTPAWGLEARSDKMDTMFRKNRLKQTDADSESFFTETF